MGETEGAGEESSGQGKVAEYEAAEASRRGWFFCGCRQVLVIADRQRRRERSAAVAGENRKLRVGVGVSWGATSGSEWREKGERPAAAGTTRRIADWGLRIANWGWLGGGEEG